MNTEDLSLGLRQHYGTENWYRHCFVSRMLYTDGVKFFAENAGNGAYWFLDEIAFNVFPMLAGQDFLHITLKSSGSSATLTVDDGNGAEGLLSQKNFEYTDCPKGDWEFYLTDNVLLLPSEY